MHDENPLASALRKINRRYIPLLFACFVIAWLDRVNVGFAALTMSRDLRPVINGLRDWRRAFSS